MSDNKYLEIQKEIESYGFTVVDKDFDRPGALFFVLRNHKPRTLRIGFLKGMMEKPLLFKENFTPR